MLRITARLCDQGKRKERRYDFTLLSIARIYHFASPFFILFCKFANIFFFGGLPPFMIALL
jgi:hypothetical protein